MKNNYKLYFKYGIFILIVYLYSLPKYNLFLPTIPIYDNNEANDVYKETLTRDYEDVHFFNLTDESVIYAFIPYVNEELNELNKIFDLSFINPIILFFKYLINRPRPYQINNKIIPLMSTTDKTPSYPAGHALQAFYLSHLLSKKYPEKGHFFNYLAHRCDDCRIKAGIHYKSDGVFSKAIVNTLIYFNII